MRGTGARVDSLQSDVTDSYYLSRMKEILDSAPIKGPPPYMVRLSDHVYIGNQRNADDIETLKSSGITHVLNCAATRRTYASRRSPYTRESGVDGYLSIPAEDREDYDIGRYFDTATSFLDGVRSCGGRALVHCNMGVNRSGAVVAAYLMEAERRTLLDIVRYLKLRRSVVLCNKGFRLQLIQFARRLGLLDAVIDTVSYTPDTTDRARSGTDRPAVTSMCPTTPTEQQQQQQQQSRTTTDDTKRESTAAKSGSNSRAITVYNNAPNDGFSSNAIQSKSLPVSSASSSSADVCTTVALSNGPYRQKFGMYDGESSSIMSGFSFPSTDMTSQTPGSPPLRKPVITITTDTAEPRTPLPVGRDDLVSFGSVSSMAVVREGLPLDTSRSASTTTINSVKLLEPRARPPRERSTVTDPPTSTTSTSAEVPASTSMFGGFLTLIGSRKKPTKSSSYWNVSTTAVTSSTASLSEDRGSSVTSPNTLQSTSRPLRVYTRARTDTELYRHKRTTND